MDDEKQHPTSEPNCEVVWPLGRSAANAPAKLSQPIVDLSGKTVAELWNGLFKGNNAFPIIRERLRQRFPGIKFVEHGVFGNIHGHDEVEVIANLPDKLRQNGVDAVITGMGA